MYVNPKECIKCKGKCCKSIPGIIEPADVIKEYGKINSIIIFNLLDSELWILDWWDDSPNIYYIRPAIKDVKKVFHPAWRGECVFLTDKGCNAPFKPVQCRDLVPSRPCQCKQDKKYYADKWLNFQTEIVYLGKAVEKKKGIIYD